MKAFAALYAKLDSTTSSKAKQSALQDYFRSVNHADAAWAVFFLAGGRPRQLVSTKCLRALAVEACALPAWLVEESYQAVGDLAETITLLLPKSEHIDGRGLADWVEGRLLPLGGLPPEELIPQLLALLRQLDSTAQLVCLKLITGGFRVGVSRLLVTRALAELANIDAKRVAQRLVGYTDLASRPTALQFQRLIAETADNEDVRDQGQPYPFFLAHALNTPLPEFSELLGTRSEWQVEWKWDGMRAQLVKRQGQIWLWSRGEDLITERFPEIAALAPHLPDGTVIDGELLVWKEDRVQPFALLQQRIGRKSLSAKLLEKIPVAMLAYDLLECRGEDWRHHVQTARRADLESVVAACAQPALMLSPLVVGEDWPALAQIRGDSRRRGVEGLMLKAQHGFYGVGRTKDVGVWWKWKIEPYTVDAVLIYAQRGHGRRASLYSDYTFAVWDAPAEATTRTLVPFAKAYSGLTDAEMRRVDAIIRKTTIEKFGPVRSVTPSIVFELGFEGIAASNRHKSGISVRFPRMLRWREDKLVAEADTLQTLRALLGDGAHIALPEAPAAHVERIAND